MQSSRDWKDGHRKLSSRQLARQKPSPSESCAEVIIELGRGRRGKGSHLGGEEHQGAGLVWPGDEPLSAKERTCPEIWHDVKPVNQPQGRRISNKNCREAALERKSNHTG